MDHRSLGARFGISAAVIAALSIGGCTSGVDVAAGVTGAGGGATTGSTSSASIAVGTGAGGAPSCGAVIACVTDDDCKSVGGVCMTQGELQPACVCSGAVASSTASSGPTSSSVASSSVASVASSTAATSSSSSGGGVCTLNGAAPGPWELYAFANAPANSACSGDRWVREVPEYGLWVGAILCSPTRYKLFLAATHDGTYYPTGDGGGHGQDHCQLVNDAFTLVSDDDITSGGCASCAISGLDNTPYETYARSHVDECFTFTPAGAPGVESNAWIECGVTIP